MDEFGRVAVKGAPPEARDGIHVLLVEADAQRGRRIREMLAGLRGDQALDVSHARRVEDALQMIRQGAFDVVLLDLTRPDGSGLDALLRAKVATSSIPILVMAEQDDESLARRALRAGAQDYLIKAELGPQLMARTVRHAVERHRMLRDLSEAQQREHYLATHDGLTGLPNRFAFQRSLRQSLADAARYDSPLGLLFLDLDGFKAVNDSLGHAAGDELLRQAASRLQQVIRKSDLAARLGGDEFVVAIRRIRTPGDAASAAENIRRDLARQYELDEGECWVTASIGIAMFPDDANDADVLIRCADTAMYHAKGHGANRVRFYEQGMNQAVANRFRLVNALRDAIDRGDLLLHFQPQIDLVSGELVAAEALLRWPHGDRGLVSPSEFVPLAEETGMAVPLGEWVLREACLTAMRWGELEKPIRVCVNVSGRELVEPDFPRRVAAILQETGLPPDRLDLEFTETGMLHGNPASLVTLRGLREIGVRITIDDFGTGYSSLTLLRELPLDALKIDPSFIREAVSSPPDRSIVAAIIELARCLGITTICEGVETAEQLRLVHGQGCERVQGYLLGKPAMAQEFEAQLTSLGPPWTAALDTLER